jgi:ubiquinone/menaquinone biosynthesis C-methylase UbiE
VLREVSNVVALDFSLESLKVLRDSLSVKERAKCLLIQGDMTILPFADQVFTKAISFQVIEHLPGEKCRHDSMCEAARVLKPDGRFIGSAYHFSEIKKKRQSPQEGFHEQNGAPIYYFHFDEPALTHLLTGAGFKIRKMEGLVLYLRGMRFLGKVAILINRCLSPTQWGRRYSHLLFFVAENNTARRSG